MNQWLDPLILGHILLLFAAMIFKLLLILERHTLFLLFDRILFLSSHFIAVCTESLQKQALKEKDSSNGTLLIRTTHSTSQLQLFDCIPLNITSKNMLMVAWSWVMQIWNSSFHIPQSSCLFLSIQEVIYHTCFPQSILTLLKDCLDISLTAVFPMTSFGTLHCSKHLIRSPLWMRCTSFLLAIPLQILNLPSASSVSSITRLVMSVWNESNSSFITISHWILPFLRESLIIQSSFVLNLLRLARV